MDVAKPFAALSDSVDADVLVALAGSTVPRSGREVARQAGRSNTGVQHALERLVEHGLVDRVEIGRTYLYTLNWDHLLASAVERMAEASSELIVRLREVIAAWEIPPVHASMFGSAARGDGDVDSDIDLFLVRSEQADASDHVWGRQIGELAEEVKSWTGNNAGIAEVSEDELSRLPVDQPHLAEDLRRDAVDLVGAPARRLLGQ